MNTLSCVMLLLCVVLPASAGLLTDPAFITAAGEEITIQAAHDVIAAIAGMGGHVYHVMPVHIGEARELSGCCLIASLPSGLEPPVLGLPFVTGVHRGLVDPAIVTPMGEEAVYAAGAWNYLLDEVEEPPSGLDPIPDDALGPLENGQPVVAKSGLPSDTRSPVGVAGQWQTSEFMIGSIAIGIVLPESTGSSENWSNTDPLYPGQDRRQLVYNKIVAAANWWAVQGGTAAALTFFYDQRFNVSTNLEPITVSSANNGETAWVGSALTKMNFTGVDAFAQAYSYDNWMRTTYSTEWAYSVFVADSLNDGDGMFPNLASAFAYIYGPYMVMTYDNGTTGGQWTLARMNQVCAHETGHVFGCPDEYAGAWTCTCSQYGYLGITNGNCANCTPNQVPCLMASNTLQLCPFTRGHVGWNDTDGDGILDPVDCGLTFTSAYLDYSTPIYSGNSQITGHGTLQSVPWPSPTRTPVSINNVVAVTYSVDSTPAQPATPSDGAFDADTENFDFTSSAQPDGTHFVVTFAVDNRGATAALSSPIYIVIDTTAPPTAPPSAVILEAPYSSNPTVATVNWTPCPPDPESGLAGHRVMLHNIWNLAPVATQYVPMPQTTWAFAGLALLHGWAYFATVQGVSGAGLFSPSTTGPALTIDLTPPGAPAQVSDGGAGTDQYDRLLFSWSAASEDVSQISDYFLSIQDTFGNPVWSGWTGSPTSSYLAKGLSLNLGTKYTGMVQAKNAAGLVGAFSPASDGIMAVTFYPSIGQVKSTGQPGAAVGVKGVYATSSGSYQPGIVYAEDYNRICGIRTDSTDAMGLGAQVDIAGLLTQNTNGELELSNSEAAPTGISLVPPLRPRGMTGRALGGAALGLQPGVTGGSGTNNIGLLVQTWGNVTYSNGPFGPPYEFTVDDGSGMTSPSGINGVLVRCGTVTPPAQGAYVRAVGVCSYENGYPVLLLRQASDWW